MKDVGAEELDIAARKFGVADYVVFLVMLLVCVAIGVYHWFYSRNATAEDYLMGGRKMKWFPTTISLTATIVSSTAFTGLATDVYLNGIQYFYTSFGSILAIIVVVYVFLPALHDLKITSIYEYLELRFSKHARLMGSLLFTLRLIVNLPTMILMPAITFSQVSGVSIHSVALIVSLVCMFYTCVGGLKAVVWSDVVQAFCMLCAILLVVVKGTIDIGGPSVVWQRSTAGERLEPPDFSFDPSTRYTIWSLTIGIFCIMLQQCVFNQNMAQRYLSLPQLGTAKLAAWTMLAGAMLFSTLSVYCGLVLYATYWNCDPITTKLIRAKDQIVPLFVMRTLGQFPGLPGIFVAGVFSAALSTLSSCLNSMSTVVLEDFYRAFSVKPLSQRQTQFLMKGAVLVLGLTGFGLVFIVEKLGSILRIVMTFGVMSDGPLVAMFSMGFLLPWVNSKGVLAGSISGMVAYIWISLGAYTTLVSGRKDFRYKPLSSEGCSYNFTSPSPTTTEAIMTAATSTLPQNEVFILYRISYMWYVPLTCLVSIVVALAVSFLTKANDPADMDDRLLSPVIRRFLPKKVDTIKPNYIAASDYQLVKTEGP